MASTNRPKKADTTRAETPDTVDALYPPRLERFTLSVEALAGAGPEYSDMLESICGTTDDSQPVEQYDGTLGVTQAFVNAHQKQAVQVQWNAGLGATYTNPGDVSGVRWGSGTMISADLMLTCGHLFDQAPNGWTVPRQNGTANAIPPAEIATNMHVNFLYQVDPSGTLRTEVSFPITQLVEYRLGGLDMAIVRVGGNPGSTYGFTAVSATNAAVGDMLAIIGHPAGMPKRIEAGPATQVSTNQIRYNDIDTLGGNSGSGILAAGTGELVGVHTNGGCNSAGTGSNFGTAIAGIIAVSPTLQALPHGSRTATADDIFTNIAADVIGTIKAADTARAADVLTIKAADSHTISDVLGTLRAADTRFGADTFRAADTFVAADTQFASDTFAAADTGWRDQVGTLHSGDVGTVAAGDIGTFGAGDDPNSWVEGIDPGVLDPGGPVIDPGVLGPVVGPVAGVGGLAAGARPFVQAGESLPLGEEVSPLDEIVAELENAVAAGQAALASLQAVLAALTSDQG